MLDEYKALCTVTQTKEQDDVEYTVENGKVYEVRAHPIDKTGKLYIIFPAENGAKKWVLFDKWLFQHKVSQYAHHKSYGQFQLPIIVEEGLAYVVVTPTGYVTYVSKADVTVGNYASEQIIECSELRFR
jgi:hypothetical protein